MTSSKPMGSGRFIIRPPHSRGSRKRHRENPAYHRQHPPVFYLAPEVRHQAGNTASKSMTSLKGS
ncbi:MAG: hypothetical protein V1823_03440 [Chloroflexota bacterium]